MKGKASSVRTRRSVVGDLETKSGLIGDGEWLIGNGSSATDHQQRRWFISNGEWLIGDGSTLQVFFLFGFLFFNLVGEWLNVFCFAEWVNVFFFFFFWEYLQWQLATNCFRRYYPLLVMNSCFVTKWSLATKLFGRYCPLLVRNLCFVTKGPKICFTFSDKFYFRH